MNFKCVTESGTL